LFRTSRARAPPPPVTPRRYFYLFVLYGFLCCVTLSVLWVDALFLAHRDGPGPSDNLLVFICFFLMVSFALSLGMFVAMHTYLIMRGKTTLETQGRCVGWAGLGVWIGWI
jgi:hypothetical protein